MLMFDLVSNTWIFDEDTDNLPTLYQTSTEDKFLLE